MNVWDDDGYVDPEMEDRIDGWVKLPVEEHQAALREHVTHEHEVEMARLEEQFAAKKAALERKTAKSLDAVEATTEKQRLKRKVDAYIARHELDDYFFKLSREQVTNLQSRAAKAAEAASPSVEQVVAVVNAAILQDVYKHMYPDLYPRLKERVDALKLLHRIVRDSSPAKKEALRQELSRAREGSSHMVDPSSRVTAAALANAMEVFGLLHLGLGCTNESEVAMLARSRASHDDEEEDYHGYRDDDDENEGAPNPYDSDGDERDQRANLERKIRVYDRAVKKALKREGLLQVAMHASRTRTDDETAQAIAEHEVDDEKVRATLHALDQLQNKQSVTRRAAASAASETVDAAAASEEPEALQKKKSKSKRVTSSFTRIRDPLEHIGAFVGRGGRRSRRRRK